MNRLQLAFLGLAITAGGGAYMIMSRTAPPQVQTIIAPVIQATDHVLVAKKDLAYGASIGDADFGWVEWPKGAIPQGVIVKSASPNAQEEVKSSFVRSPISNGEPIRRERLVKGSTASMMSTMLSSGKRAISIDVSANTTAGGFVLPNDRVDIVKIFRDHELTKDRGADVMVSELVVSNVRVLAVGQAVESKHGEATLGGATATIELDPHQAQVVLLAQRTGQLALELRPLVDAHPNEDTPQTEQDNDGAMTIVRYGVSTSLRSR